MKSPPTVVVVMASIRRYEHKLATQRRDGERVDALVSHLATDKMLRENFKSDERVEKARDLKEMRTAAKEQYATQQLQVAAQSQYREKILREQDERLAAEISKRKTEAVREQKNMQRICEQSEELRVLEEKLKAAYMNKEREAQIHESAVLLQKTAAAEAEMASVRRGSQLMRRCSAKLLNPVAKRNAPSPSRMLRA